MTDISYYDLSGRWIGGRDHTESGVPTIGDHVVLPVDGQPRPHKVIERFWRNRSLSVELYVRPVTDDWANQWAEATR